MRVLGFMSGTSLDGVDAAILDTDGETVSGFGPAHFSAFSDKERGILREVTEQFVASGSADPALLANADQTIVDAHIRCAQALFAMPEAGAVNLIGYHGQTVLHRPERGLTIQIGDPARLASALRVDVIADVRKADMAAGGQGAPLVPVYHAALARKTGQSGPVAFLNIGGVANLTFIGRDGELMAFDTGPGNGMLDLLVQQRGLGRYDQDGLLAARGTVHQAILQTWLAHPYFARKGPKSLDRYDFPLAALAALNDADAAATLVAFSVQAVALAARALPERPKRWIVCGGGRHNPVIMGALRAALGICENADEVGLRGDFIEAEAIGFVAARCARGLPSTFPETTGVSAPTVAGKRYAAQSSR